MKSHEPRSLIEAITYFADADVAFGFVMKLRWPDGSITCPRCGHGHLAFYENRRIWRCHGCKKQFSIKVGTIFEDSPIGFDKWLPAIWLIANSKNSVSSHELGRALSVTQKTAWFMLHRIREAMVTETFTKMNGTVEIDETYVGGEAKNMHEYKRVALRAGGKRVVSKVPVQGARQRETGKVTAMVVPKGKSYKSNVEKWVSPGTTVYTDQASAYRGLSENYIHDYVTHGREYVRGNVHTNGIETSGLCSSGHSKVLRFTVTLSTCPATWSSGCSPTTIGNWTTSDACTPLWLAWRVVA